MRTRITVSFLAAAVGVLGLAASSKAQAQDPSGIIGQVLLQVAGANAYGQENWNYLQQNYDNPQEMAGLCQCAQGWSNFTSLHYTVPGRHPNPKVVNDFSDSVFKEDGLYKQRISSFLNNPYNAAGVIINTNPKVSYLGYTADAKSACLLIQYQGARLAHEMSFRQDKPGINALRTGCNVPWPYHPE
jgi:hypothetical protein